MSEEHMPKRKYITEFAILSFAEHMAFTQQNGLDKDRINFDPHIYMIARRPKIILEPNTFKIDGSSISGFLKIHGKDKAQDIKFKTINLLLGTSEVSLKCDYPYSEFTLRDNHSGEIVSRMASATILAFCDPGYWKFLDLEILYVGQSFGNNKNRNAIDRLKKHETLQKIYAEAIRNFPDQDIWLLLFHFSPLNVTSFSAKNMENPSIIFDNDHIKKNLQFPMTNQQFINFTEAALIKYFQPEYNKRYKNIFPSPAHLTYKDCYNLDLNLIAIEIQSEALRCRLWSHCVAPNWTHLHKFFLHNPKERKEMFDLLT